MAGVQAGVGCKASFAGSSKAKPAVLAGDQCVSKAFSPDMLQVLDMDLLAAALMLKLKEEQAAIKTVTPLELSLRDCLLLSEIPSGACSHFQSFTSFSSSSGFVPPSAHSLPLLYSLSLTVSTCDYLLSLLIHPFLRENSSFLKYL